MQRTDSSSGMNSLVSAYAGGDEDEDLPMQSEVDNISDEDDDTPNPTEDLDFRIQPDKRPRSITPDSNPKPPKMERKGKFINKWASKKILWEVEQFFG